MSRYARQDLIDWLPRDDVATTRVLVIGAGAVGNELIKNLALLGVGEVHIHDLDTIEEHNLTRSVLFRETDVGLPKAVVAAQRAQELDPNVRAVPYVGDFWDNVSVESLRDFDWLACCVDNFEARIRCNILAFISGTNFVNLGIDSRYCVVETFPFAQNRAGGCYECTLPDTVYQRIAQRYSCGHLKKISFVERKVPTTIMTSAIAAALAVSRAMRFRDGAEDQNAERILIDTITGNSSKVALEQRPGCPGCSLIAQNAVLLRAGRMIGGLAAYAWPTDAMITLSEPVLVGYSVGGSDQTVVFARASDFDDTFPSTVSDDADNVELEIRDQFTAGEFFSRFAGLTLPIKFAALSDKEKAFVFEFGGDTYE